MFWKKNKNKQAPFETKSDSESFNDYANEVINNQEVEYYGVGTFIWEVAKVFFWALVIIIPIRVFLLQPFYVQGASMEPNFTDGDYLIINEFGLKKTEVGVKDHVFFKVEPFFDLKRGEIVVFHYPRNPSQIFIKRVIALGGEKIKLENGQIWIFNDEYPGGVLLDESVYLDPDVFTKGSVEIKLAEDEYFVMGDNREFSHDSRAWGPVNKSEVIGKVLLRAWPFDNVSVF